MSDTTAEPTADVPGGVDDDDPTTGAGEAAAPEKEGPENASTEAVVVSATDDAPTLPRRKKGKRSNRRRRQQAAARRAAAAESAEDVTDEATVDGASSATEPEAGESRSGPDQETATAASDAETADDASPDERAGADEADDRSASARARTPTEEGGEPADGEDVAPMRTMFGDEDGGAPTPSLRKWNLELELAPRDGTTDISDTDTDVDPGADQDRAPRSGGRSPRSEAGVGEPGALVRMADGAVNAFRSVVVLWLPVLLLIAVVAWSVTAFIMS